MSCKTHSKNAGPTTTSPELATKAKLIKDSPFFSGWTKSAPFIQKQMIFYVLAGLKPTGNALSGTHVRSPSGTVTVLPDDPAAVGAFLDSLGLFHHLVVHNNGRGTEAFVSLDPALPEQLFRSEGDPHAFGLLLGFPKTAVDAFRDGTLLPHTDQARLMTSVALPEADMPDFRLSRDHAAEELEVLRTWWRTMQAYDLT